MNKRYYNIKWSTYFNTCKFNTRYKCTHKQKWVYSSVNPKAEWLLHTCITWTAWLLGLLPRLTYTRENNIRLIRKLNRHKLHFLTIMDGLWLRSELFDRMWFFLPHLSRYLTSQWSDLTNYQHTRKESQLPIGDFILLHSFPNKCVCVNVRYAHPYL